ncbi:hypothetical protein K9O30_07985 [Clostridium bowmanii]|uniref:hypothetical protein n=1 Tax=Clostridium bowmanii TaxID=132925 RepID=UPI001C0B53DF|nr:hypothetical protein [Clostridium bowmanii]MBU3188926.1 hypothetical protein [Clostridium bowmanii]MCA1073665.1 hypothetical protein [Clostridium bowmanii]
MHKKIIALCLVCSVFGSTTAFATTNTKSTLNNNNSIQATTSTIVPPAVTQAVPQTTLETAPSELIGLDKYITRNSNGTLTLDVSKAIKSSYQSKTVNGLAAHLDVLNKLIKSGELVTDNNLNINITNKATTNSDLSAVTMAADVGVTVTHYFWWGYNRYLSNNTVHKVVGNLNGIGGVGGTYGAVCGIIGVVSPVSLVAEILTSGYILLLANRIDTNNVGRGVCIHMANEMVYTVVSQ